VTVPHDRGYGQGHLRAAPWKQGVKYTRANVRAPAAMKVDEDRYLVLALMNGDGELETVAGAPIPEVRLTRVALPTPGASIVIDFGFSGTAQWLVDFFWPQVVAASTGKDGQFVPWRARWNVNRPVKTTRGAHRLRQVFIDTMLARGATLVS
jgi:hypothetical protein